MIDRMDEPEAARESLIVDVSQELLSDLIAADSSTLRRSMLQILGETEKAAESISGWASYVD